MPDHYGPTLAVHNGLTVICCHACNRCHLFPLPDPEALNRFYVAPDGFYKDSGTWFDIEREEHRLGLWEPLYRYEIELLIKYLGWTQYLIDLGAGSGWFIWWCLKKFGIMATGVEPSGMAPKNGPFVTRHYIYNNLDLATAMLPGDGPVYLRARLVLEHLADPVGFLREAASIDRGVKGIIITVPNDFNPLQQRIMDRSGRGPWFVNKVHCNYFDRWTLAATVRAAGFEPVHIGATHPIELWQLAGAGYLDNDQAGQRVHRLRLRFEQALGGLAFRLYKYAFDRYGWGRELIMVARKVGNDER